MVADNVIQHPSSKFPDDNDLHVAGLLHDDPAAGCAPVDPEPTWASAEARWDDRADVYTWNDLGRAYRLIDLAAGHIRYSFTWEEWLVYEDGRWTKNMSGALGRYAHKVGPDIIAQSNRMKKRAEDIEDKEQRKAKVKQASDFYKQGVGCGNKNRISSMLSVAQDLAGVSVQPDEFDANPWLLGIENGVIDLRSGTYRQAVRGDMIMQRAGVRWEKDAQCPTWERFLSEIMCGDAELVTYLQRAVGYSLTGSVQEQCLFFLFGGGSNGKSTFLTTIQALMGTYARQASKDLLLDRKHDPHPVEFADLHGRRMVVCGEIREKCRLAEDKVKTLTGGDRINARWLHQNPFEFDPTHTVWQPGNHKPTIRGMDDGIWRRIRLVPFLAHFEDKDKDETLPERLREELPGILRWAVRGCMDWQRHGLGIPEAVKKATGAYRSEMDDLAEFFEDECVIEAGREVLSKHLYARYRAWAADAGHKNPMNRHNFGKELRRRGFHPRNSGGRRWVGLDLRTPPQPER